MRFQFVPLALLFTATVAGAQTKDVVEEVDAKLATLRVAARHADERNEDVEILRRLLNKSLGLDGMVSVLLDPPKSWYMGSTGTVDGLVVSGTGTLKLNDNSLVVGTPQGKRVTQAVSPFDGVYLKGAGVVYTLRIPAGADFTFDPHTHKLGMGTACGTCHQGITPNTNTHYVSFSHSNFRGDCNSCHTSVVPSVAAKPLTEWEQAKMALRGEKPKEPEPTKVEKHRSSLCDPGTLTEQLTAQLYAHAKNVRHLGEKESITLVVTFDSLPGAMQAVSASGPAGKPGFTPEELQKLTLGDLHTKQGKHAEAVEAYLMGLVRFRESVALSFPPNIPHKDATAAIQDMTASVRGTYKSLAAAYLQMGHMDDAKAALEKATSLTVSMSTAKGTDTPKTAGPAKLILSVTKADIAAKDAAAFKKAVTVERMNFPAAEGKKAK